MPIYNIPGIVKDYLPMAASQINIAGGFQASRILPYNINSLPDNKFLASSVKLFQKLYFVW